MPLVKIYNKDNQVVGDLELNDLVFGVEPNEFAVSEVVKWQLACRRRGTHSTKTKAEVRGGGKKPWKQKHTGRARTGSTRNPHWVGGGVAFGPRPRDYSYVLPKKVKKLALKSVLSGFLRDGLLRIVSDFDVKEIKTRNIAQMLNTFDLESVLIVDCENNNLFKSVRNLANAKYLPVSGFNVYDALRYKAVLLSKQAVEKVQEHLLDE